MRAASRANDIDFELLKALIATESGFDSTAVSPKGAVGLMQVMPATAQRYGVTGDKKTPVEKMLIVCRFHPPITALTSGWAFGRKSRPRPQGRSIMVSMTARWRLVRSSRAQLLVTS